MMPARLLYLICVVLMATACQPKKNEQLLSGTWRVDSVYTHYNGFSFMRKDVSEEPLIEYRPKGELKMTKGNESRYFNYEWRAPDSLFHHIGDGATEKFIIERSNKEQLVLRRPMQPLFRNQNQLRYEIRFMTRVERQ